MPPEPQAFRALGVDVLVAGATPLELFAIRELFERWEETFSRFRPDSELSRVNRHPLDVVLVSPLFGCVLRRALAAAGSTGGLVDPTLGAALAAAGYDRDFGELRDLGAPGSASGGCWRRVRIDGCFLYRPAGVELDLNGVVKGMVVDEALALIAGEGFVSAGGDLATRGALDVALPGGGSVCIEWSGLATSGSSRRRWVRGGAVQHHLLEPRTGRPASSRWSDVTVVAATCSAADVAAKAAFLLSDDGPGWIDAIGLAGRFLAQSGEIVTTPNWPVDLALAA